jgi:hypothetical protein
VLRVPAFEFTPTQVMVLKNFKLAGSTYFDIGSGLLPFSITLADATSYQARAMLVADRVRADAFDIGADPESGSIGPGEVSRLRNLSGYLPQGWTEARTQIRRTRGLLGALMGNSHPVVLAYGRVLHLYDRLETRLESEPDHAYGRRLGPAMMLFYVQFTFTIGSSVSWMWLRLNDCPHLSFSKVCTCSKFRTISCGYPQ